MRPELERLRRIEEHLRGPAGPAAACLAFDARLPADLAAQRHVYAALQEAGQRQLRQEVAAIHERLYGTGVGRWVWAAATGGWRLAFARWGRLRGQSSS